MPSNAYTTWCVTLHVWFNGIGVDSWAELVKSVPYFYWLLWPLTDYVQEHFPEWIFVRAIQHRQQTFADMGQKGKHIAYAHVLHYSCLSYRSGMSLTSALLCPVPNRWGIKRCFCLTSVCLTVWRLSVAYIGPISREQKGLRRPKLAEVAHITRDSGTTFKVKSSKVKVTRPLCSPPCWRVRRLQRWAWERWAWDRVGRGN